MHYKLDLNLKKDSHFYRLYAFHILLTLFYYFLQIIDVIIYHNFTVE